MLIPKEQDKYGNRHWKVTTAPASNPIELKELKEFARIDGSFEDAYLNSLISAVVDAGQKYMGRALVHQTVTLAMDFWPNDQIEFPRPPLSSVTQVRTLDEDDAVTIYSADNYMVITASTPGKLVLKRSVSPPTNTVRTVAGFEIAFVAGYGAKAENVPHQIRQGLLLWATAAYDSRIIGTTPPPSALAMLDLYKVVRI